MWFLESNSFLAPFDHFCLDTFDVYKILEIVKARLSELV